ncbi:hypothetical protein [Vibrio sp. D431a]|uniref:hypothetical protein n=1 Tax=Vibrio sp. D431a TaxID=2837388 RepID=UPI002555D654|nr:hypothetical protein [Vibrio sp. D431a]MDK9793269.1 hypothetical protein [Vibrio sp. D431a]
MSKAKLLYTSFVAINSFAMAPILFQLSTDSSDFSKTITLLPALALATVVSLYFLFTDSVGHPLARTKASTISAISVAIIFEFLTSKAKNAYMYFGEFAEFLFNGMPTNIKNALTNPDLYQSALPTLLVCAFLYFVYHAIKGALEIMK